MVRSPAILVYPIILPLVRGLSSTAATISSAGSSTSIVDHLARISYSEVPIDKKGSDAAPKEPPSTSSTASIGERVKQGESVLQLHNLATRHECQWLVDACTRAAQKANPTRELDKPGLVRLPTIAAADRAAVTQTPCADPLSHDIDLVLQQLLQRATSFVDEQLPSLSTTLFDAPSISKLLDNNQLKFSSREPAINVYTAGGEFLAHKDAQALTVLLPLSCPTQDFEGGGTAFWSQDARGHRVEDPSLVVKAPAGTALLFGGCVTHAGVAVERGSRVVFVASFSSSRAAATLQGPPATEHRDIYGDSM